MSLRSPGKRSAPGAVCAGTGKVLVHYALLAQVWFAILAIRVSGDAFFTLCSLRSSGKRSAPGAVCTGTGKVLMHYALPAQA